MAENKEAQESDSRYPIIFGEYEAIKSIGKGKFAVVYRARKIGEEEIVALKRISVEMMDEKAKEKCLKEVRLLQSLDHPNIIRYYDSFINENDLIIIYEWAAAGDLKRQLRKAQERGTGFEERVVWKYFSQICNAMQHMHDRRIMHRDLKPANIFLTLDGTIKVGDLGLSRELSEHTIQAHSKVGTPLYMSPEVLKGDGYDFKTDIWSLGCLLYELAMLKSPFKSEGLNLYSLFQKISNGDYQPLPETYSEELRTLVYSMISTRPQDRPEISYVVDISKRMRTSTNDKHLKSRGRSTSTDVAGTTAPEDANNNNTSVTGGSAGKDNPAASGGNSRPNSGRPLTNEGKKNSDNYPNNNATPAERVPSRGTPDRPASGGNNNNNIDQQQSSRQNCRGAPASGEIVVGYKNDDGKDSEDDISPRYNNQGRDPNLPSSSSSSQRNTGRGGISSRGGDEKSNLDDDATPVLINRKSIQANKFINQDDEKQTDYGRRGDYGNNNNGEEKRGNYLGSREGAPNSRGGITSAGKSFNNANNASSSITPAGPSGDDPMFADGSYKPNSWQQQRPTVPTTNTDRNSSPYSDKIGSGRSGLDSAEGGRGGSRGGVGSRGNSSSSRPQNITDNDEYNYNRSAAPIKSTSNYGSSSNRGYSKASNEQEDPLPYGTGYMAPSSADIQEGATATVQGGGAAPTAYRRPKSSSKPIRAATTTTTNHNQNTKNSSNHAVSAGTASAHADNDVIAPSEFNADNLPKRTNSSSSTRNKAFEDKVSSSSVAFAVMEVLYAKLVVLGYPLQDSSIKSRDAIGRGRLLPMHFACDLQIFSQVAGHDKGYQFFQFRRMSSVAIWLCNKIGFKDAIAAVDKIDTDTDTPVMVAKQLLRAVQLVMSNTNNNGGNTFLKNKDADTFNLADVSPTSIAMGYGLNVCNLLMVLADAALASVSYTAKPLVYVSTAVDMDVKEDDDEQNNAESDDEIAEENIEYGGKTQNSDNEDDIGSNMYSTQNGKRKDGKRGVKGMNGLEDDSFGGSMSQGIDRLQESMIMANEAVDPKLWKEETDRVAARLINAMRSPQLMSSHQEGAWLGHMNQLKTYVSLEKGNNAKDNSSNNTSNRKSNTSAEEATNDSILLASLNGLKSDIDRNLLQIKNAEKILNSNVKHNELSVDYSQQKKQLEEYEERMQKSRASIETFSNELAEIEERCEDQALFLQNRDGNGDQDGGGTSSIVRLKGAIRQLKTEIKEMDVSLELLSHQLRTNQMHVSTEQRVAKQKKLKVRRNYDRGGDNGTVSNRTYFSGRSLCSSLSGDIGDYSDHNDD